MSPLLKTIAALVNYKCKTFIKSTPGAWYIRCNSRNGWSHIVLGSLSTTQASLAGESQVSTELFSSPSHPIDAKVWEKLRAKIWNNEFFDFKGLLSNPVFEDRYQVTITNADKEKIPLLCFKPVSKAKKHFSIQTWLICFHVFVGVYTSRCLHEMLSPIAMVLLYCPYYLKF